LCRNIDEVVGLNNIKLRTFLRNALGCAYSINNAGDLEEWFKYIAIILLSPNIDKNVDDAIHYFSNYSEQPPTLNLMDNIILAETNNVIKDQTLQSIAEKSPFRVKFQKIRTEVQELVSQNKSIFCTSNTYLCPKMLD